MKRQLPAVCLLIAWLSISLGNGVALGQAVTVASEVYLIGISQRDITPDYPIRLSGFGGRRLESEGVRQSIFAKAIAIADEEHRPTVLVTIDNLGISTSIREAIAKQLAKEGVHLDRFVISASHTHTAPMLRGVCPTLFGVPIPEDHQAHIDLYTDWLIAELVVLVQQAIADMRRCTMEFGVGKVSFAANRRNVGGPVDHDLPLLVVRDCFPQDARPVAILVNYACHCVTLSDNKISGDWAGYAHEAIERQFPGTMAMVAIGCGADANPSSGVTGDRGDIAALQGAEIATEVVRMMSGFLQPVNGKIRSTRETIELPLQELPTRQEWEERAKQDNAVGYHARYQIAKLDRGEQLMQSVSYEIQTWTFGTSLAMVFLPGEVVVDYALRIKKEFDNGRLFVNAYSNDSPGYVPSERILREGGYEGGGAMTYYGIPTSYGEGLEEKIYDGVQRHLGTDFRRDFDPSKTNASLPLSAQQAALAIQVPPGLRVDLAVAEPLVVDPVAIDFGPDGRLWVAEMNDYPSGETGNFEPGGRIRVLRDNDGDGRFDTSTIFAEGLPFPTGITVWRDGVLVCAAPSIFYMPDRDRDDRADEQRVLYTGFGTDNYQARVNSLEYGLDGWLYGSCGLFGGRITSTITGEVFKLGDRDFRIQPDTGLIEPATGRTQQGRVRDDWGNWFGCDNSDLGRHYPIADHYLKRNPHVAPLVTSVHLPRHEKGQQLFPANASAQRFKLSGTPGQTTAACGIGVYRDVLLGAEYQGNLFTCEPVNLLVHRMRLESEKSSFGGYRSSAEIDREFAASTDNWFRPVQMKTGPEGALWIVDMCRFIIEHPRWIPPEDLAKLDERAGNRLGRIYRVVPSDWSPRDFQNFETRSLNELPKFLNCDNGWQRDMVSQLIRFRCDSLTAAKDFRQRVVSTKERALLADLLKNLMDSKRSETRLTALCLLAELRLLDNATLMMGLADNHPGVRRQAIRLCEPMLVDGTKEGLIERLIKMVDDRDAQVRLQLACTLGEYRNSQAGQALFDLVSKDWDDTVLITAALSSVNESNVESLVDAVAAEWPAACESAAFVRFGELVFRTAASTGKTEKLQRLLAESIRTDEVLPWQFSMACRLVSSRNVVQGNVNPEWSNAFGKFLSRASSLAKDDDEAERVRLVAITVLGLSESNRNVDIEILINLLRPQHSSELSAAALARLTALNDSTIAERVLADWDGLSPSVQAGAIDMILARPIWQETLVRSMESKEFAASALNTTQRDQLASREDSNWQQRVRQLWSQDDSNSRMAIVEQFSSVADKAGDLEQGKLLFEKRCSVCHRLREQGYAVGPDLDMAAGKSIQFLLTEVLDPNRNVDSRYAQYVGLTKDGRIVNGLLAQESSNAIVFRGQENKEVTVLRSELESLKTSGKSLMPEGIEKDISPQDFADIFAYLKSVPIPYKIFEGNQPAKVTAQDGQLALLARQAEIRGGDIVFEKPFGNIGYWHGADDYVAWQIDPGSLSECEVYVDYACDSSSAGYQFEIDVSGERLRGVVVGTGGWSEYRQIKVGNLKLTKAGRTVVVRPVGAPASAVFDLRAVYFVQAGHPIKMVVDSMPTNLKTADDIARYVLDEAVPSSQREAFIGTLSENRPNLIRSMTAGISSKDDEYRRIPWIWRVAIRASRENKPNEIKGLLEVGLPNSGQPLQDWQSVVIGGGLINGLSLEGIWPKTRIEEVLKSNNFLMERWKAALQSAMSMCMDPKVPSGTRYDALRMIAMNPTEQRISLLRQYLEQRENEELQMGAVSGLGDIEDARASEILVANLGKLAVGNRGLAIKALLRTETGRNLLSDAIQSDQADKNWLDEKQMQSIRKQ